MGLGQGGEEERTGACTKDSGGADSNSLRTREGQRARAIKKGGEVEHMGGELEGEEVGKEGDIILSGKSISNSRVSLLREENA